MRGSRARIGDRFAERCSQCLHHAFEQKLNRGVEIIARGELPATESKLLQAGANGVVSPTISAPSGSPK
jgi:hypothetical protein